MEKEHKKLTLEERERMALLKATGKSLREIAVLLGRHPPPQAPFKARKRKSAAGKRARLKNQMKFDNF